MTDDELKAAIEKIPYFYHKIELRPGITTNGWAPLDPESYRVPERVDGENILDVGAWDGFWTFEALKRGAKHVTAIEDFSDQCGERINADRSKRWETFDLCAEALGYKVNRLPFSMESGISKVEMSVEHSFSGDDPLELSFNRVFCFGLLYHLRNPVRALENCFKWMSGGGTIHIETAILDNITSVYTGKPHDPEGCYAEFYPTNQFGMNASNWWVPTMKCAAAWLQAAGFVEIEQWKLTDTPKNLAECRGFFKARKPD